MNITSAMTLRRILRRRPLSVVILEMRSGYRCWNRLEESLSAFCAQLGLEPESLLEDISRLPALSPDTDWDARPIYELIDHLTRNHADFREKDMPAIASRLQREKLPAYPDGYVVTLLLQEFRHFQVEFLKHMEEEEIILFPRMLRNEACYRYPELEPEGYRSSASRHMQNESHRPDEEFQRMIISVREKLRNQLMNQPAADIAHRTLTALESLEARLLAHSNQETGILFPRAGWLEQVLHEASRR